MYTILHIFCGSALPHYLGTRNSAVPHYPGIVRGPAIVRPQSSGDPQHYGEPTTVVRSIRAWLCLEMLSMRTWLWLQEVSIPNGCALKEYHIKHMPEDHRHILITISCLTTTTTAAPLLSLASCTLDHGYSAPSLRSSRTAMTPSRSSEGLAAKGEETRE